MRNEYSKNINVVQRVLTFYKNYIFLENSATSITFKQNFEKDFYAISKLANLYSII